MTIIYKLIYNRKYNRVINWINRSKTLILIQHGKKNIDPNHDKFDDPYSFIRVVFMLNNQVVLNVDNSALKPPSN